MMKENHNIESLTELFLFGELTSQEKELLRQLLKTPENKAYFREAYIVWRAANDTVSEKEVEDALQKALFRIRHSTISNSRKNGKALPNLLFPFKKLAIASVISLVIGLSLYHLFSGMLNTEHQVVEAAVSKVMTPLGSKAQVELPDGTVVTLNAGSELYYSSTFGIDSRDVWLKGEGYFKVAKNEAIPFIVQAKKVRIKALGTEFNVKAYPDEAMVQTTLVSGAVSVRKEHASTAGKEWRLQSKQTVTIYDDERVKETTSASTENLEQSSTKTTTTQVATPSQITGITHDSDVKIENNVKTELYTSWKDSRWLIEKEQLGDLVRKLERKYNVKISFANEQLRKYSFSGTLEDETFEQILEVIKLSAPINYSIKHNKVVITYNKWIK
jgi:ferric-dicitrate binding protein FerR (iron transport regulator)